jgi:hypothetical protein
VQYIYLHWNKSLEFVRCVGRKIVMKSQALVIHIQIIAEIRNINNF